MPTSTGKITVDGIEVSKYDMHYLRSNIGLVSQEPVLFSGTIEENIRNGNQHATRKQIRAAAKVCDF